jgi:hypothetical protein
MNQMKIRFFVLSLLRTLLMALFAALVLSCFGGQGNAEFRLEVLDAFAVNIDDTQTISDIKPEPGQKEVWLEINAPDPQGARLLKNDHALVSIRFNLYYTKDDAHAWWFLSEKNKEVYDEGKLYRGLLNAFSPELFQKVFIGKLDRRAMVLENCTVTGIAGTRAPFFNGNYVISFDRKNFQSEGTAGYAAAAPDYTQDINLNLDGLTPLFDDEYYKINLALVKNGFPGEIEKQETREALIGAASKVLLDYFHNTGSIIPDDAAAFLVEAGFYDGAVLFTMDAGTSVSETDEETGYTRVYKTRKILDYENAYLTKNGFSRKYCYTTERSILSDIGLKAFFKIDALEDKPPLARESLDYFYGLFQSFPAGYDGEAYGTYRMLGNFDFLPLYHKNPDILEKYYPDIDGWKGPEREIAYQIAQASEDFKTAILKSPYFTTERIVKAFPKSRADVLFANFKPASPKKGGYIIIYDDSSTNKEGEKFNTPQGDGYNSGALRQVADPDDAQIFIYENYSSEFYEAKSNSPDLYVQKTDMKAVDMTTGKTIFSGSGTYKPYNFQMYWYNQGDEYHTLEGFNEREEYARRIARLL